MKGVVFLGDRKLELRRFPDPTPGPRDVILEIKASGMCGSDLHNYRAPANPGGVVTGGIAPSLNKATAVQVVEALRTGPFLMPRFTAQELSAYDVNSIARYVLFARHPVDRGGWGIGHIGPVPEGMVAWFIAFVALVIVARLIGERSEL